MMTSLLTWNINVWYVYFRNIKSLFQKKSKLILIGDSGATALCRMFFWIANSPVAKVELKTNSASEGNDNPIITNSLAVEQGNINLDYTSDKKV